MSECVAKCKRCGTALVRPERLSSAQWALRKYCSKRCAGTKRLMSDEDVVKMYCDGKSSAEVAVAAGVSAAQVLRILKANNTPTRPASEGKRLVWARPATRERMTRARVGFKHSEAAKEKLRARIGEKHNAWKGGLTVSAGGYLQFTASRANGALAGKMLHRVVAEWMNGGPLEKGLHVHHADENKMNNDPANIQILTASEHARLHALSNGLGRKKAA